MTYRRQLREQGKITPVHEYRRKAKPETVLHEDEIRTCLSCTRTECSGCGEKKRERMRSSHDNR